MGALETLTVADLDQFVGTAAVVEVTWIDWEAPADTWTPVARHTAQGTLRWVDGQGPDNRWPVVWFTPEDAEVSIERLTPGDIVRVEASWGAVVGMDLADVDRVIGAAPMTPPQAED
jgi:hypothetical protein